MSKSALDKALEELANETDIETTEVEEQEVDNGLDGQLDGLENETENQEGEEGRTEGLEGETESEAGLGDEEEGGETLEEGKGRVVIPHGEEEEFDPNDKSLEGLTKRLEATERKLQRQMLENKLALSGLTEKNQTIVGKMSVKYQMADADVDEMIAEMLVTQPNTTAEKGKTTKRVAPKGKVSRKPANKVVKTTNKPNFGKKSFGSELAKAGATSMVYKPKPF